MSTLSESELWDEQFDPSHDFPTTTPSLKYAICTTPRCGSHFLGHRLYAAGGFGYPLEYVNGANFERWSRRARDAAAARTLDYIKSIRTDVNGVFGIKVHFRHLSRFLANEPDVLSYRFITLERRDLLKQAVSYCWAAQTRSWISGMPARAEARYDWEEIATRLREIAEGNAGWRSFLAGLGIAPCHLVFEDVRADPDRAVSTIAAFLGITPGNSGASPRFLPEEQAERGKKDWVERFAEETRDRLARGEWPRDSDPAVTGWRKLLKTVAGSS